MDIWNISFSKLWTKQYLSQCYPFSAEDSWCCFTYWSSIIGKNIGHKVKTMQYFQETILYIAYFDPFKLLESTVKMILCMWVTSVGENYMYMHNSNSPSFDRTGTDKQETSTNQVIRLLMNNLRFTCLGNFIAIVKY